MWLLLLLLLLVVLFSFYKKGNWGSEYPNELLEQEINLSLLDRLPFS